MDDRCPKGGGHTYTLLHELVADAIGYQALICKACGYVSVGWMRLDTPADIAGFIKKGAP